MTTRDRYDAVLGWFAANASSAESELKYRSDFELLVAVMLSAQCTDKRVNTVTPALFAAYPDAASMAKAAEEDILRYISSVSYPNSKAKHLKAAAVRIVEDFGGRVPSELEQLQSLPGVGRKTANVVMAVLWQKPTMAVDTHIFRVSNRIGLTDNSKNPLQTEKTLTRHIPPEVIPKAHHWLLLHGRYVCQARSPKCSLCGISDYCKSYKKSL